MTGAEVVAANPGSFSAVVSAGKAFVVAHPIGSAVGAGAILGVWSLATTRRYFAKRKMRKEIKELKRNQLSTA
jgi:hypothetical protein